MWLDRRRLLGGIVGATVVGCGGTKGGLDHQPGTLLETRKAKGREYVLFHPRPKGKAAIPLMLCFHGGGGNGVSFAEKAQIAKASTKFPMMLVFPNGTAEPGGNPNRRVWNGGHSPNGRLGGADDVAFVRKVVQDLKEAHRIDNDKIFALGFSSGGQLTYRLAVEMSDVFVGVGVIAAAIGGQPFEEAEVRINDPRGNAKKPVNIFHIHGETDKRVHIEGGPTEKEGNTRIDLPLRDAIEMWVERNGTQKKVPKSFPLDTLWRSTGGEGGTEVRVKVRSNQGHGWNQADLMEMAEFLSTCRR